MRILLLNQDWFAEEWRALGHEVVTAGHADHLDVRFPSLIMHIDSLVSTLPGGFTPDRIVIYDNSAPLPVAGLDDTKIPTFFYSVDVHHHAHYHRYLAHLVDGMAVAQKDYIPYMMEVGPEPKFMPLWASRYVEASEERNHGAVFVGNMNADLNPQRVAFFEALRGKVDILCTQGKYWEIFPFSEVVVNQTVKGDLNFRVFEAMMCGTMLLTEYSGNGLFDLFRDGHHLVTYQKDDVDDAAKKIRYFLAHPEEARAIGRAGREEILRSHLPRHRAVQLLEWLEPLEKKRHPLRYFGSFMNFSVKGRRMEQVGMDNPGRAYVWALRAAQAALEHGEKLNADLAIEVVRACLQYDRSMQSNAGQQLLDAFAERNPQFPVLTLARIRLRLNSGRLDEARQMAAALAPNAVEEVFREAEGLVVQILETS